VFDSHTSTVQGHSQLFAGAKMGARCIFVDGVAGVIGGVGGQEFSRLYP